MNIQGTVVSFTPNTKIQKRAGGSYDAWELAYRTPENELKTIAKPAGGLRFNPALAGQLNSLVPGEAFTAVQEKNGEFWEVKSVVKGHIDGSPTPLIPTSSGGNSSYSRGSSATPKSTYETPEERAKKQVVISRQAALNTAVASFGGDVAAKTEDEILARAKVFEKFVYANVGKVAKAYIDIALEPEVAAKE